MAMGYSANVAIVISEDELMEMGLSSYRLLRKMMEKLEDSYSDYDIFDILVMSGPDSYAEVSQEDLNRLVNIYESFLEEFKEATGIGVYLNYHDSHANGDRYDEVDGMFFELEFNDIYEIKPTVIKARKKVDFDHKYFVQHG